MENGPEKRQILFPSFERLGDTSAGEAETRRTWKLLFLGMIASSAIAAAMLPDALENEIYEMPPGPVAEYLLLGNEWWRERALGLGADIPAADLRQAVLDAAETDWNGVMCRLEALGIIEPASQLPRPLAGEDATDSLRASMACRASPYPSSFTVTV